MYLPMKNEKGDSTNRNEICFPIYANVVYTNKPHTFIYTYVKRARTETKPIIKLNFRILKYTKNKCFFSYSISSYCIMYVSTILYV